MPEGKNLHCRRVGAVVEAVRYVESTIDVVAEPVEVYKTEQVLQPEVRSATERWSILVMQ